jgi:nucleosome assembly protein 1-like 1
MGRKDEIEMGKKGEAPTNETPEDSPMIKTLKELEDKYLELEREYEAEVHKIQVSFEARQKPFLEDRAKRLAVKEDNSVDVGTPALPGFWTQALKNHPAFEDEIQEWDEPVMAYLKDVTVEQLSGEVPYSKGYKVHFHFEANPYFEPSLLTKEYHLEEVCPYRGEDKVKEIKSTEIQWKPGKDVTVEKVQKKVKGGGAKKNKQKKEKEEARDSFFRKFFRHLKCDDPLPDDLQQLVMQGDDDDDSDDDDMDLMEEFMENDRDLADALKDQIVPFAVRWYTGEAAPEDDDDDDEESEEEDESSSEEEEPPVKKGGKKKPVKGKESPATGPAAAPKEECKQQ